MPVVKFLNGEIAEYEEKDIAELSRAIMAESMASEDGKEEKDEKIMQLIPNENSAEDGIDFFAFFEVKKLLILNITQQNYFSYDRQYCGDTGYNAVLRDLFTADIVNGDSHWHPEDRVIFVPTHLREYVAAAYGQLKI